jgi:AcrR family transcriptional regulator
MARKYTQTRRAEQQAETRQRIVEAALKLHTDVGPNRTTFSMVAEEAGVQRHTLYAHFPDERSLLTACSGHAMALNPMPDAVPWKAIADPRERLRTGLGEIYAWYERTAQVTAHVVRDAEQNPVLREVMQMRRGPKVAGWWEALGAGLDTPAQAAMLGLAFGFQTWRALAVEGGLGTEGAAALMADAVLRAASP